MKTNVRDSRKVLLAALLWAVCVSWCLAAEAQEPHFVWSMQACVEPGQMDTYMKARVANAKLAAKHGFEFPYLTFVDGFSVHTAGIFTEFAQLDGVPQRMKAWHEKTGGRSRELEKKASGCVRELNTWISVYRPDLSHGPENASFTPDLSKPFYQFVTIYHIQAGMEEEAEAVARKIKRVHDEKDTPVGYRMYQRICGQGVPTFAVVMTAKDKATFAELDKQMQDKPDPEIEKIMKDSVHVLTGVETKQGTYVPAASCVPEQAAMASADER